MRDETRKAGRQTLPQHDINLFLDLPQHVFCPQHDYTSMTRLGNCLLKLQKKICGLETILSCQRVFGILEYISMFCSMTSVNLHPTSPHTPHFWSIIHHLPNSAIARPARAISALSSLGQPCCQAHCLGWAGKKECLLISFQHVILLTGLKSHALGNINSLGAKFAPIYIP